MPKTSEHAYVVGLGSNLGDRLAMLRWAVTEISAVPHVTVLARSKVYATVAVGPSQGAFLNAAVHVRSGLAPLAMLDTLLAIEAHLGRVRHERWGPRLIDLDILWAFEQTFEHPRLVIPHPELRGRAFALRPLLDLVPGFPTPPAIALDVGVEQTDFVL